MELLTYKGKIQNKKMRGAFLIKVKPLNYLTVC